jgi:uncharacterized protein YjbI with pentapeptide repeats
MANQEHLDILNRGAEIWNKWRKENPDVKPDLSEANLSLVALNSADLSDSDLSSADLSGAYLSLAKFRNANLSDSDLSSADLSGADLHGADLSRASVNNINFNSADLSGADLMGVDFYLTNLYDTNLSHAILAWTAFNDVDLRPVKGLETLEHKGPSSIGIDTIYKSQGNIPEAFLKGAGVDDNFIAYIRSLVDKPIEYYSCFISYSSKDQVFAERLYADLQSNNVRCWFAPEDMKIGDKIRPRIDEAIRIHDKLLLVLSEKSVESDWVEKEVETAFEKERKQNKTVLFPIRLDDCVMITDEAWAADIRRTRHIGDFRGWKRSHDKYQKAFDRLLRDLKAESQTIG